MRIFHCRETWRLWYQGGIRESKRERGGLFTDFSGIKVNVYLVRVRLKNSCLQILMGKEREREEGSCLQTWWDKREWLDEKREENSWK